MNIFIMYRKKQYSENASERDQNFFMHTVLKRIVLNSNESFYTLP